MEVGGCAPQARARAAHVASSGAPRRCGAQRNTYGALWLNVAGHGAMVMLPGRGVRAGGAYPPETTFHPTHGMELRTWVQKGLDMIGDV